MKRSKILGMCKAAESWLRDSQLFLEKLVSKNSIQLIFLSKTILRMESVTQQQRWRCPFKHLVAHFPLLCWCLFTHLMFDKASSLNELGYFICGMACKQKPVSRLDLVGKSHECQGVTTEGKCHPPTDNLWRLFHVIDGSNGKTPVGYRAPEMLQKWEEGKRRGKDKEGMWKAAISSFKWQWKHVKMNLHVYILQIYLQMAG